MPDKRIIEFISEHHVMSLACAANGDLWCARCFYVFLEEEMSFVITSEEETRHAQLFMENPIVTGSIALETEVIGKIRGLQFRAIVEKCDGSLFDKYRLAYLKRFPYAILKGGDIWRLVLTELKYTDNRLGFGKKLKWKSGKNSTFVNHV